MKITWFGHSCFRIETGGSVVLIDPFLKGNPTFEKSNIPWDVATDRVTHVALTHGHDDHVGDAVEVCVKRNATLFAVYELAVYLSSKGVKTFEPMNTGGTVCAEHFGLTFVDALHSSSSHAVYLGNPCGIVLDTREGTKILHMGDTEIFPGMQLINEIHHPDIGIVPIGDRFTMGARTAALACRKFFSFKTIIPCHYGTFEIIAPNADQFIAEAKPLKVTVPQVGAALNL